MNILYDTVSDYYIIIYCFRMIMKLIIILFLVKVLKILSFLKVMISRVVIEIILFTLLFHYFFSKIRSAFRDFSLIYPK